MSKFYRSSQAPQSTSKWSAIEERSTETPSSFRSSIPQLRELQLAVTNYQQQLKENERYLAEVMSMAKSQQLPANTPSILKKQIQQQQEKSFAEIKALVSKNHTDLFNARDQLELTEYQMLALLSPLTEIAKKLKIELPAQRSANTADRDAVHNPARERSGALRAAQKHIPAPQMESARTTGQVPPSPGK